MARRLFKPGQIINKLREDEVLTSQGDTIGEASRKIGITEQTYSRWRKRIWWHASGVGQKAQRAGEGKRPAQEAGGRPFLDNAILKEVARETS